MVRKGINLIPGEERFTYEVARLQKKIRIFALGSLLIAVMGLIFSYLYFLNLGKQLNQLSRQTTLTETKIREMQQKEGFLFLIKNRANLIGQIFKNTTRPIKTLVSLEKKLPEGILFTSFEADSSGKIKIVAYSKDLSLLNQFMSSLSDSSFSDNFNIITISSIGRSESGNYSFVLELNQK